MMNNNQKRKWKQNILLAFFVLFLAFLFRGGLSNFAKGVFIPVAQADQDVGNLFGGAFSSKRGLLGEIAKLKQELKASKFLDEEIAVLRNENALLKKELGNKSSDDSRLIAGVITTARDSFYREMIIDTGSQDGVMVGDKIFASENIFVGYVSSVSPKTSSVKLLSFPSEKIELVHEPSDTFLNVEGTGGSAMRIFVPRDFEINEDDMLLLPGIETSLAGVVEKVISDSDDPEKHVLIRMLANPEALRFVFVLKDGAQ